MEQTSLTDVAAEAPTPGFWPPGYDRDRCRSCKAPIVWATKVDALGNLIRNPKTSRPIKVPLDLFKVGLPAGEYTHVLMGAGRVRTITRGELPNLNECARNHFRSCVSRDQHRRSR